MCRTIADTNYNSVIYKMAGSIYNYSSLLMGSITQEKGNDCAQILYDGSCLLMHIKMTAKLLQVNSFDHLGEGRGGNKSPNNFLSVLNIPTFHTFQAQCFISDTPTAPHWS